MKYLLDTNSCIDYLNVSGSVVARKVAATERSQITLCAVVKAELYHGAYKSSKRDANLTLLADFFSQFESLSFDDRAAEVYGRLRAQLAKQGNLIGPNDLMIAAIALANDRTLISHNTREFGRVAELRVEDWAVAQ